MSYGPNNCKIAVEIIYLILGTTSRPLKHAPRPQLTMIFECEAVRLAVCKQDSLLMGFG